MMNAIAAFRTSDSAARRTAGSGDVSLDLNSACDLTACSMSAS